jgi:ABC-type transport system involved in multi-copper enzyme maturation permease subunit
MRSISVSSLAGRSRLLLLSARLLTGRKFWIAPLLPLLWIAFQVLSLFLGWRPEDYTPPDAQTVLIGIPLTVLGIALGVRIIAGEIDQRTLEISYTVPGGTHRVWLAKLVAASLMLVLAEALLAAATFFFCTGFPAGALYGALQAAVFYMALAMGLSTLFKSEATGALVTIAVVVVNGLAQGGDLRASPFWNPAKLQEFDAADVLAWTVQNRIGFLLVIGALTALTFARADRREKML